jgi:hypothetical protein
MAKLEHLELAPGMLDWRGALVADPHPADKAQDRDAARSLAARVAGSVDGRGDMVIEVASRDMPDPATGTTQPAIISNRFRIENGQLAEHWDALPPSIRPASPTR